MVEKVPTRKELERDRKDTPGRDGEIPSEALYMDSVSV